LVENEHDALPSNALRFTRRERAARDNLKKPTILRAKRSGASACSAAADFTRSLPVESYFGIKKKLST
jgi:hypothetical protein